MDQLRKQFSLDWLVGGSEKSSRRSSSASQPELDEAVFYYGQPIFRHLSEQKNQEMRLHDLARALKDDVDDFKFDELWEVIRLLASREVIQVTDTTEASGNYKIRLLRRK